MGITGEHIQPLTAENKNKFFNRNFVLNSAFILFILLILVTRVLIFFGVNIPGIDSDQPFMWAGVKDYAEGKFHEPRFYGQDYNTFMEALFAVPLYWLKVPVYYALPIATHVISLFPFLFTAAYLFFKGRKENALLILAVLLCLPLGYDIMNSIPRGFVPGLFFTSFFIISILNPRHTKWILINSMLAVTGYFVNPNSLLVSLPFLFYLFLMNYRTPAYYRVTVLALLWAIPLFFLFNYFYKIHPGYVVLGLEYNFTADYFWDILSHLDRHFAHINFFVEERSFAVLGVIVLIGVQLFRKNKKAFYAYLFLFGVILFSFFSAKTEDGVVWPFYSYSRIFLGVPLFIALFTAFIPLRSKLVLPCVLVITIGFSIFKFSQFNNSVDYHTKVVSRWNGVHLIPLNSVLEAIHFFKAKCDENNCDHFIIANAFWLCTYMNYGGQAIVKDFPTTEESAAERRYWVRETNKDKIFQRFVFLSSKYDFDTFVMGKYPFDIKRLDDYGLFLIEHNQLKNKDFLELVRNVESE